MNPPPGSGNDTRITNAPPRPQPPAPAKALPKSAKKQVRAPRQGSPAFWLAVGALFCLGLGGLALVGFHLQSEDELPTQTDPPPLNKANPPGQVPEGMVWVPGGWFWMGSDNEAFMDARPLHLVYVDGFWMDKTEVTNAQFAKFVEETKYVTVAERKPDPKEFPGVPAEKLVAG